MASDRFVQEISVEFTSPVDVWKIAADSLEIVEAAFGESWAKVQVEISATTSTQVSFHVDDVDSLRAEFESYGGVLSFVAIHCSLWDGASLLSAVIFTSLHADGSIMGHSIDFSGPSRVEVEGMGFAVQRSVESLRRKRRWSQVKLDVRPMEVWSDTQGRGAEMRRPVIRSRGVKPALRRWFILHRDEIILTLGGGFVVSVVIILLQFFGVIPVPH